MVNKPDELSNVVGDEGFYKNITRGDDFQSQLPERRGERVLRYSMMEFANAFHW